MWVLVRGEEKCDLVLMFGDINPRVGGESMASETLMLRASQRGLGKPCYYGIL
jgi:hypothetical protein